MMQVVLFTFDPACQSSARTQEPTFSLSRGLDGGVRRVASNASDTSRCGFDTTRNYMRVLGSLD